MENVLTKTVEAVLLSPELYCSLQQREQYISTMGVAINNSSFTQSFNSFLNTPTKSRTLFTHVCKSNLETHCVIKVGGVILFTVEIYFAQSKISTTKIMDVKTSQGWKNNWSTRIVCWQRRIFLIALRFPKASFWFVDQFLWWLLLQKQLVVRETKFCDFWHTQYQNQKVVPSQMKCFYLHYVLSYIFFKA